MLVKALEHEAEPTQAQYTISRRSHAPRFRQRRASQYESVVVAVVGIEVEVEVVVVVVDLNVDARQVHLVLEVGGQSGKSKARASRKYSLS